MAGGNRFGWIKAFALTAVLGFMALGVPALWAGGGSAPPQPGPDWNHASGSAGFDNLMGVYSANINIDTDVTKSGTPTAWSFIRVQGTNAAEITGTITGNDLWAKSGSGTLTLSKENGNKGGVALWGGTLELKHKNALGAVFGTTPKDVSAPANYTGQLRVGAGSYSSQGKGNIAGDFNYATYLKIPQTLDMNYRIQIMGQTDAQIQRTSDLLHLDIASGAKMTLREVHNSAAPPSGMADIHGHNKGAMRYTIGGALSVIGASYPYKIVNGKTVFSHTYSDPSQDASKGDIGGAGTLGFKGPLIVNSQPGSGGSLALINNSAKYGGGIGQYAGISNNAEAAYYPYGQMILDLNNAGSLTVSGNTADQYGGGIMQYMEWENSAWAHTGTAAQITTKKNLDRFDRRQILNLPTNAYFSGNAAGAKGGAIYMMTDMKAAQLTLQGNTFFENNYVRAANGGGAIYIDSARILGSPGAAANQTADQAGFIKFDTSKGIIAFKGNRDNATGIGMGTEVNLGVLNLTNPGGTANSIFMNQNTELRITGNSNLYFDDPIKSGEGKDGANQAIYADGRSSNVGNTLLIDNTRGDAIVQFAGGASVLNVSTNNRFGGYVDVNSGVFRVVTGSSFTTDGKGESNTGDNNFRLNKTRNVQGVWSGELWYYNEGNTASPVMSGNTDAGRRRRPDFKVASGATLAGGGTISAAGGFVIEGTISPDSGKLEVPDYVKDSNSFKMPDNTLAADKRIGTLTLNGGSQGVNLTNATLLIETSDATGQNSDKLKIEGSGTITFNNTTIKIPVWNVGEYTVIEKASTAGWGSLSTGEIPSTSSQLKYTYDSTGYVPPDGRRKQALVVETDTIKLKLTPLNTTLTWTGGTAASPDPHWYAADYNQKNWKKGTAADSFLRGDLVKFDDSAASKDVKVTGGGVMVSGMEISKGVYTFGGDKIEGLYDPQVKTNNVIHEFDGATTSTARHGELRVSGGAKAEFSSELLFKNVAISGGAEVTFNNKLNIKDASGAFGELKVEGANSKAIIGGSESVLSWMNGTTAVNGVQTITLTNGTLEFAKTTSGTYTYAGTIGGTGTVKQTGLGVISLTGNSEGFDGTASITSGALALTSAGSLKKAVVDIAEGGLFTVAESTTVGGALIGGLSGAGNVSLGAKTLNISGASSITGEMAFGGVIEGDGGLTVLGGIQKLAGANTYTGETKVAGGTLKVSNPGAMAASSGLRVDGGTFEVDAATRATFSIQTFQGGNSGEVKLNTATVNGAAVPVKFTTGAGLTAASVLTFWGKLSGTGSFIKEGDGTLTLTGDSSAFAGTVLVSAGTLEVSGAADRMNGNITVADGGILKLGTTGSTVSVLTKNAGVTVIGGGTLDIDGSQKIEKLISDAASLFKVDSGDTLAINDGVLAGTAPGGGVLTISNLEKSTRYDPANSLYGATLELASDITVSDKLEVKNGKLNVGVGKKLTVGNGGITLTDSGSSTYKTTLMIGVTDDSKFINTSGTLSLGNNIVLDVTAIGVQEAYKVIYAHGGITGGGPNNAGFSEVRFNNAPVDTTAKVNLKKYVNGLEAYKTGNDVFILNHGLVWNNKGELTYTPPNPPGGAAIPLPAGSRMAHGVFDIGNGGTVTIADNLAPNTASSAWYTINSNGATGESKPLGWDTNTWDGKTLTKTGDGTLVLSGDNTYEGGTWIAQGTLRITKKEALHQSSEVNVSSGAVFELQADSASSLAFTNKVKGEGSLLKSGAGTVTLKSATSANPLTYTGETVIAAGTLKLEGAAGLENSKGKGVVIGQGAKLDITDSDYGTSLTAPFKINGLSDTNEYSRGTLALGDKALEIFQNTADASFNGQITGDGGTLIKTGDKTLLLGGDNDFSGGVYLSKGRLYAEHSNALGTGILTVNGAGTVLGLGRNGLVIENDIELTGDNDLTLYSYSDSAVLKGKISGDGGIIKTGRGSLTLQSENNYYGDTYLRAGTLRLIGDSPLGNYQGTLYVEEETNAEWKGEAALALNGSLENKIEMKGQKDLSIAVSQNEAAELSGEITGKGGIKKTEAGSLTLSGEEKKYEGVTEVTKGTLAISGTSSIESSAGVKLANMTALDIAGASSLVTIKGLTGTGEVKLGAQTLAVNKASGTDSFKGVISGTGGLVKDGAGIFALESAQKYTGDTEIKNGTLRMNGKDVLSKSETVSIAKGAVLDTGGADQAIQYLHAQEGAKLTMSAAKTLSLGGGVIEKLTAENAITNLAKVQGNTGKDTLSLKTDLTVTSFTNQKGTVNVGLGNKLNVSGTAYLQNDSTTGLAIKYDYTGGGDRQTERPANPVLTAKELKIADGAKLNITGLPQDVGQYMVIKTTGSNISGKFGEVQFNGEKAEIDKAPSLTSFHNGMKPIYKEKEIWVENGGYVWDNIADKTAHGTFFVDGDEVELNLKLNDRSGATGAFYGGWDGSTFTKTGKGTLALGGSNSYFGNTEIKDGTLKIASNGVLENTKGDVVLGGSEDTAAKAALELNYQESGTFTKAITGTGDLNKTGTGTVTVSGGTRLEGSVSVQAGTLALTGDTSFKNGTVAIKDKATLDISGVKEGEGEITFKSLFNEGTLKLGQKALVVDNALTANAAGKLSGSGTLEYKGGGTGIMSFAPGSSDFTGTARVNTGTINLAGKDALASASVDVQKGQARSNTDQTLMGLHLGDTPAPVPASESRSTASLPSLVKVGNSWQWQDSVGAAITDIPQIAIGDTSGLKTLTVNKNIGGNGTVLANAVLNAGAEFSPGNSPGTLLVDGNMTFKAGSIYKVDVDIPKSEELNSDGTLPPNYHDSLVVDGAATIEKGAKLSIGTITDLRPLGEGKSLEIKIMDAQSIQKDGNGTGGNFEIADDFLFYNPEIMFKHHISSEVRSAPASRAAGDPDATELWLVIKRSAVSIEDITKNPNENNIVDSIRSKDANDQGLLDDLNLIRKDDEDKLEEYLKDISGEIYGDLPSVAEDINRSLGGSIRGRFSNFHQYRSGFSTQLTEKDRERYMPLWVNARGVFYDHRAAYGGNAAVDVNGGDVQAGFELGLGQNRKFYLGFAAMGGLSNVEVKERESKALFTTFGGGLYGGTFFPLGPGDLVLGLGASYGLTFGHIRRDVVSGINIKYQTRDEPSQPSGQMYQASLDETLETDYRAHAIQGILDLGWDYLLTDLIGVEPYIGATWLSVITEAFQEQTTAIAHPTPAQAGLPPEDAGRLALEGQAQHNYTIASLLGARVVRHFNRKHRFDVDVNWQHIFDPARHRTKQTIRIMGKRTSPEKDPDGGWFDVEGANADIDTFNGRLGYGFNFTPRMLLKASYNAQFGYSSMSHGAELLFEYTF